MDVLVRLSRETELVEGREKFILRNWLMQSWGLPSPKSAGWAVRVETGKS